MFSSTSEFPVDLLGRYKLIGKIGSGAMGVVYRAYDANLRIDVAIKTLGGADDRKRLIRFQKEARAIGGLKHPNIVRLFDFGVTRSGDAYMVMEYVEGKSLNQFLAEERAADLEIALRIFHQICEGVAHAHRHGVIHRDLKSSNVMLESADTAVPAARIIDFGIAQLRDPERSGFQSTGRIVGSPAYMSPESSRGQGDARGDVYSLGCLLFECLTGSVPFEAASLLEMARCHAEEPPPRLRDRIADFDEGTWGGLQDIVDKCLAKDPNDRYQTVERLIDDVVEAAGEVVNVKLIAGKSEPSATDGLVTGIWKSFPLLAEHKPRIVFPVFVVALILGSGLIFMAVLGGKLQQDKKMANMRIGKRAATTKEDVDTRMTMFRATFDKTLRGYHMEVTDRDIKEGRVEDAQHVYKFAHSDVTDDGVRAIVKYDPRVLDVGSTKVTDEGLKEIPKMKNLGELRLDGLPGVTDSGLHHVINTSISSLSLKHSQITDRGLAILSSMKRLGVLKLDGCRNISDRGLVYLGNLPALHEISIERTNTTPRGLKTCKQLTTIGLGYVLCNDDDMVGLAALKKLSAVDLTGTAISGSGLNRLLDCPELVWLGLGECKSLTASDIQRFQLQYAKKHKYKVEIESELPYRGARSYRTVSGKN